MNRILVTEAVEALWGPSNLVLRIGRTQLRQLKNKLPLIYDYLLLKSKGNQNFTKCKCGCLSHCGHSCTECDGCTECECSECIIDTKDE